MLTFAPITLMLIGVIVKAVILCYANKLLIVLRSYETHLSKMDFSVFDRLIWLEMPIWFTIGAGLAAHVRHDYTIEKSLRKTISEIDKRLAVVDNLEATMNLILAKLIPEIEPHD